MVTVAINGMESTHGLSNIHIYSARLTRLQSLPAAETNSESLMGHHIQGEELANWWQMDCIGLLCWYGLDTSSGYEFAFPACKAPQLVVVL